jgi:hypothetical protein
VPPVPDAFDLAVFKEPVAVQVEPLNFKASVVKAGF